MTIFDNEGVKSVTLVLGWKNHPALVSLGGMVAINTPTEYLPWWIELKVLVVVWKVQNWVVARLQNLKLWIDYNI